MIFLIWDMAFLAIGLATDQTVFTWIAIAFIVISLDSRRKVVKAEENNLISIIGDQTKRTAPLTRFFFSSKIFR